MITKIFHPNISKTGEICVDTLKKGWKREYGIGHVLVVRTLLFPLPTFRLTWRFIDDQMSVDRA